ncbi:PilN domain-containing protein [Methylophaga sp.]|uniref:PilN domain-containing protein n=1 Tax=Methylophaga sp. TaxID=2024840 RepID=UPI002726F08F|nr:PilN domain-containing protein [Methylophaga sp.]MDO8826597.1 PilN domain-containing protein [Methylophaga sp.]
MAHINLLPWREEKRQERQKQFYIAMGLTLAFAILVFYFFTSYMNGLLSEQNQRNNFLQQEITKLDIQIKEIQDLEKKRDRLLARMQVIQDLQQSRPKVVKVFDSLVRTVPEGTHLQVLTREGDKLIVQGVAQTNARVSVLMNQLDQDPEFSESKLRIVQRTSSRDDAIRQFTVEVNESKVKTDEEQ